MPKAAGDALRWRHSTLDLARQRAAELHLDGAAFPWRTIRGHECSSYWPAGTAAFHINADIACAVVRYVAATGDDDFERDVGLEMLVEVARLLMSLGHHDRHGRLAHRRRDRPGRVQRDRGRQRVHEPDGGAGSGRGRRRAPSGTGRWRDGLGVDIEEEAALARRGRDGSHVPYNAELGVHEQAARFTEHAEWDFERYRDSLPAPAARAVLRPVPQAGGQAGRPGARDALVRRPVHAAGQGAQRGLLRAAHGARLVAVGRHPGDRHGARWGTSTWPTTTRTRRR